MEAMATRCPQLQKKLRWLLMDQNVSDVARRASEATRPHDAENTGFGEDRQRITPHALYRYLEGSAPPPDVALRIANALGVDPLWLIDESHEVPDPEGYEEELGPTMPMDGSSMLRYIKDVPLRDELTRRYSAVAEKVRDLVGEAEQIPWERVSSELRSVEVEDVTETPQWVQAALEVALQLWFLWHGAIRFYQPKLFWRWGEQTRLGEPDRDSLNTYELYDRIMNVLNRLGQYDQGYHIVLVERHRRVEDMSPDPRIRAMRGALDRYWECDGPSANE